MIVRFPHTNSVSCAGALDAAVAHGARPMPRAAHTARIHFDAPRGEAPPSRSAPPRRELGGRAATTPPPATPAPLATRTAGVAAAGGGAAAARKMFLHTALRNAGAAACRGPSAPLRSGATKQEEERKLQEERLRNEMILKNKQRIDEIKLKLDNDAQKINA